MQLPQNAHVAVVDGTRFLLLQNSGSGNAIKLGEPKTPDIDATNFSAGIKHQDSGGQQHGSTDLNELAHAAGVAEWLNQAVLQHKIEALVVIADPKSLGEMRRHYHKQLGQCLVGEISKTLTSEPTSAIADAIAAA